MRIGIDTGGTFTDFVWTQNGCRRTLKVASTPDNPSRAVIEGLKRILEGVSFNDDAGLEVIHGTTVATNALLTRSGGRVLLVTTEGLEDVLEIGRQNRPALYDLHPVIPEPLVLRALRAGAAERIAVNGAVVIAPPIAGIERVLEIIEKVAPDAIAVCLLNSPANPTHERMLFNAISEKYDGMGVDAPPVFLSSELDPYPREYERTSTTVIHAYLSNVTRTYLADLESGVGRTARKHVEAGIAADVKLRLLVSNGGMASVRQATVRPADLVLSGPAGGVVGAAAVAKRAGVPSFIGLDMGGTSTDVCLGHDGRVLEDTERDIAGFPLRVPRLAVHTIGAGGGSIARRGAGGALLVGPESAGANPGPAAYGIGECVTVTDANLVLGRLPSDIRLGGYMTLDIDRSRHYMRILADGLGLSVDECALGIIRIANEKMARAVREISQMRGFDTRTFTLVPFGGAGALHACEVAELLGISHILVPPDAGCLSALGAVLASERIVRTRTVMKLVHDWTDADASHAYAELARTALLEMDTPANEISRTDAPVPTNARKGIPAVVKRTAHCRYAGQGYELTVNVQPAVPSNPDWTTRHEFIVTPASIAASFHAEHQRQYGYNREDSPVEIVAVSVSVEIPCATDDSVWNAALPPDGLSQTHLRKGPFSLPAESATIYVAQGWHACLDECGNVRVERE